MKIHWIEENTLAAGSIPVKADDIQALSEAGIGSILTLTENPITTFQEISTEKFAEWGVDYMHIPVEDHHAPTVEQVSVLAQYINRMKAEGKPVYLHCAAGIGRTGTMLHAYYLVEGLALDEAKQRVKFAKPSSQYFMLSAEQKTFVDTFARELTKSGGIVLETVYFQVIPGHESAFMSVFSQVSAMLSESSAHINHNLQRASEDDYRFLLLVRWQIDEEPDAGFMHVDVTERWQPLLQKHLFDDPLVERYQPVKIS